MKRAGFTMIELIFVIVILGILSAVALPKFIGVSDQAHEGLVKGFVGTLNRTVGAAKWSASLMDGASGSIKNAAYNITVTDTEFPEDLNPSGTPVTFTITSCADDGAATAGLIATGTRFKILCVDGNTSTPPKFYYSDKATTTYTVPTDSNDLKI